jgi:predicted enzyme related to lactoylglutathione lyase
MKTIEFILYVANQEKSKDFYEKLLLLKPCLDAPGMTEFELARFVKLGLMPEHGIAKILSHKTPHPNTGSGIPRCEVYLKVENAKAYIQRAMQLGAKEISELQPRDWGETVGYLSDLDGHILAFAEKNN